MDQGQGNSGPGRTFFVTIPFLPPTGNHIYITDWRRKKRFLSSEAAAFKQRVITHIGQEKGFAALKYWADVAKDPYNIFSIYLVFYFPHEDLVNETFGKLKKDGTPAKEAAQTRYKRMDVENRVKLSVDSVAEAIAIDDCLFFDGGHAKCSARLVGGQPQIHVYFDQADPARFGL